MTKTVFCDFDGTITAVETFAGMLKEFSPDLAARLMPQMYERTLTLSEGVTRLLQSIESRRYGEILAYAESKPVREGFSELLTELKKREIPFVIISGGLRGMIETVLDREKVLPLVKTIYAVDVDRKGEYLKANSDYADDNELVAKGKIISQWTGVEKIAIGDSVTDITLARGADLVFARDRLIDYLQSENIPYIPWDNFFQIRDYLSQH
ncbi:MAG: 2-hydroxy-3-keto-5-methylthiopentenyl-1-phosphate phosphatase [Chroococcopsis gigantea SAG 12.99]|jgi:2-hydroxy-3-keto-5-methylthiopentenyl-1-phosphate phosphatase|nr:HAD-IB family phosphatase [Chlorogloea purpurea SAG 13.99]MDV2999341.1 2-hydroxy-3-keto-5-methylthiopentenyl-1-phosphate phosphatase [Chroococcopsis gigantea SAG 12.99]